MKTITFYSYKGGVGRSLALTNFAKQLSEFGKTVCVLDFDLEAPGLHIKFQNQLHDGIEQGMVDYIYEFQHQGNLPSEIGDYTKKLRFTNNFYFIPAGNSSKSEYWMKLSRLSWSKLFYEEDSEGVAFFLDFKEKILQKYNPDYLLIDSRTGISELSAITLSLLADSVVILAANNKENIDGCKQVINSLAKDENNLFDKQKDVHFILTRIPLPENNDGKTKEEALTRKIFAEFDSYKNNANISLKSFSVIHSDRNIEFDENIKIGYDFEKRIMPIAVEYRNLFNKLTDTDFTQEERKKITDLLQAETLFQKAFEIKDKNSTVALELLEQAIALNDKNARAFLLKAIILGNLQREKEAIEIVSRLIEDDLYIEDGKAILYRAFCYFSLHEYQKALNDLNVFISKFESDYEIDFLMLQIKINLNIGGNELFDDLINKYPTESNVYGLRSSYYCQNGDYENAINDIYKALELDTENPLAYATLAEIKLQQGDVSEFYRNFELALKYHLDITLLFEKVALPIYKPYFEEERFLKLLEKYDQHDAILKIKQKEY